MKKNDFNLPSDQDQKLIEDRVFLEIEDKGATAAEKMAMAETMADSYEQPPKKKSWGGWWAAALFALLAVGCCIYLATRDSKMEDVKTSQTSSVSLKNANLTGLKSAASTSAKTVDQSIDGVSAYGKYPIASDDLINQEASDGRKVDYLYYFANNQSAITENAILNDIAEAAKNTNADITITAYASPTGSAAYNEALSEQRAENLEKYFEARGVTADHIKIVAGGQTDQFGSDAYNRRADILVNYGA